jgi:DNA mismatch repair protein MutL
MDIDPGAPRIRLLPDDLVDQIAAGEVVERPASVVKELVENALDAGAARIRVEVRDGGASLIAVTDDGSGMSAEDARRALERHATSKITSGEDLVRIRTFGFRGEALPAIASVSRMRLRTRARGAAEGFEIRIEGGKLLESRAAGGPEGTRIEVADLFANVPARRKFLKSAATEWGHVAEWLARAALALPSVHFDVQHDDRPALTWPAVSDPIERVAAVLSEREAEGLVPTRATEGALCIEGFVSRPDVQRSSAAGLHLFVNRRPVRDRLLRHALLDAYRDVLPRGRYPTALLFLEVPPESVDVNVHPAKWEVRFADPAAVHRLVARSVRQALEERRWIASSGGVTRSPDHASAAQIREAGSASDWIFSGTRPAAASGAREGGAGEGAPAQLFADPLTSAAPAFRFAELRLLGQVLATYLVAETRDGLVLIDQHAAHERVLYEGLRAAWREGGVARQPLLLTETVELAPDRVARVAEAADALLRLGFEVEPFGDRAVAVRAIPALLAGHDPVSLLRDLADQLDHGRSGGTGALRDPDAADALFASLACHAARRAGERLETREQHALLAALDTIPFAPTCPHGRPVAVPIGRNELERRFGRS